MVMVRLMGGLGNQMFQYAVALRLATKRKTVLRLDLTFLLDRAPRGNFVFRDFDLAIFNVPEKAASAREVRRFRRNAEPIGRSLREWVADKLVKKRFFLEESLRFDPRVLDLPRETYLEGYFQNQAYFADIEQVVRSRFRLAPNEAELPAATRGLAEEIRAGDGICLHVRRGDYVTNPESNRILGVCSLGYYLRGLEKLNTLGATGKVFVFSDDEAWCHENFGGMSGATVVEHSHAGPRSSTHLWLMTLCRHFVIPNSSFGWWAAWLSQSPKKIVVRPSRWFQKRGWWDVDVCPPEWIGVSNI